MRLDVACVTPRNVFDRLEELGGLGELVGNPRDGCPRRRFQSIILGGFIPAGKGSWECSGSWQVSPQREAAGGCYEAETSSRNRPWAEGSGGIRSTPPTLPTPRASE